MTFIEARKEYSEDATVRFHPMTYTNPLPEPDQSVDLLISQFAGFVSLHCKRYLRLGGYLIVNDSHGDASMANIDPAYHLDRCLL